MVDLSDRPVSDKNEYLDHRKCKDVCYVLYKFKFLVFNILT